MVLLVVNSLFDNFLFHTFLISSLQFFKPIAQKIVMFLNRLSLKEKTAFLEIAHYIAHVDEDFSEQEQVIIDKFCMEMQIDDVDYDQNRFDIEKCLDAFSDDSHKKIVLLEMMALVYSDGVLHQKEEATLNFMVEYFGLNPNLAIVYKEWSKSILSLFIQGEALIHL